MTTKSTEPLLLPELQYLLRRRQDFNQAMSQADVAEVDMTSKKFITKDEAAELITYGYQIFACVSNSSVRFLRREGSPDLLFYT